MPNTLFENDALFSHILDTALVSQNLGGKEMEELLKERGVSDISYKRVSDYRRGLHIPAFERAKAMMEALDIPITDEQLLTALKNDKERRKRDVRNQITDNVFFKSAVRFKPGELLDGCDEDTALEILHARMKELYGSDSQFSAYVTELIRKDLEQYIVEAEEEENGN